MRTLLSSFFFLAFLSFPATAQTAGGKEVLPNPPTPVTAAEAAPQELPLRALNPEFGRRTAVELKIAADVLKGHFRAKLGRSHAASWFADSVRRLAEQLEAGCIDRAPWELLARNVLVINAQVDELIGLAEQQRLASVQRDVLRRLTDMDARRTELMAGIGNALE